MKGPCGLKHQRIDRIDEAVWRKVTDVLLDEKLLAEACQLSLKPKGVDWGSQLKSAERTLKRLETVERDVLQRNRRGQLSSNALDHELGEIKNERELATVHERDGRGVAAAA